MAEHARHAHSHQPAVRADTDRRRLAIALGLITAFMAAEVVAGILAHSLALLSDAAHMLTDAGALALSLLALTLANRPARGAMTFGFKRTEILSALVNGGSLLVLAALIVYEAIRRLVDPPAVAATTVLAVALAGIVVNLLATWQLARANRENLAVEGSFQHILTDLYAFIGTAVAAVVILTTGFDRADPIASLLVAASMLWAAYGLLKDSGRVLLEMSPEGMDVAEIGNALASQPHVASVHDLHVWEIGSGFPSLSAHVLVHPGDDCHAVRRELELLLERDFGIDHTTLQVDHEPERVVQIASARSATRTEPASSTSEAVPQCVGVSEARRACRGSDASSRAAAWGRAATGVREDLPAISTGVTGGNVARSDELDDDAGFARDGYQGCRP